MGKMRWVMVVALLATTARADVVLGVQVGRQALAVRQTVNGATQESSLTTDTAVGLVAGIGRPGGGDRLLVGYESYRLGDAGDLGNVSLAYHWFFPVLVATSDLGLRPFLGGEAGYGWLDLPAQPGLGAAHDSNVTYGARAGLNLVIAARAEIELGLRYTRLGLAADQYGSAGSARFAVDSNSGWWLGFNLGL